MNSPMHRDYCIDALKMLLIALVIYGHIPLLDGLINEGVSIECDSITWSAVKGVYAFHMPLFVLISGYFTKRRIFREQVTKSLSLIRLFLIFHSLDLFLNWCYSGVIPGWHELIYPGFALWYLLCLFYWRILVCLIPKNWDDRKVIVMSVVISLLIGFVPIYGEFGLHRFFSFMPFFLIGHYYGGCCLRQSQIIARKITPPIYILLIIATILLVLVVSFNPRWLDVIISPYSDYKGLPLRIAYLLYSLLICLGIMVIFKRKNNWCKNKFSTWGADTLFFYLYHPYVLYSVVYVWSCYNSEVNFGASLLITFLTIVLLALLRNIKLMHYILR